MDMNISVVLVRTKYPENIGSVARACLNMGVSDIILVDPQNFDQDKAAPLATVHAKHILQSATIVPNLDTALADFQSTYGTTARMGGWRKGVLTPDKAALEMAEKLASGERIALVFGPEDKGLTNEETTTCGRLINIPTSQEGTSLNLSQAVLILLYEAFRAFHGHHQQPGNSTSSRQATHQEQETLFSAIQDALLAIDFLKSDNPDYWMLPVRRFFQRFSLKRHEYNLLMGICRQVKWMAGKRDK
ncbi:MAG: RNA methyltransferase [Desulfovibrio sp.]|uniref:RNA methyltransferase n=1 Tax=Desulfovibrio sp. 7SRBS1 TaxID=3378064 RepID=UPI003B3C4592